MPPITPGDSACSMEKHLIRSLPNASKRNPTSENPKERYRNELVHAT
jgi:hypothetical protein